MKTVTAKKSTGACAGRPREFDEDKVLAAAANAFWQRGYHATSVDDLCTATGLLRGSLYGAYGDKRGIFLAALNRYCESRVNRAAQSLSGTPGREVLRRGLLYYVQAISDLDLARACFITNTALELTPEDREVAQVIERTFRRMSLLWGEAAVRARKAGAFKAKLDEKTVGDYLFCIVQGLRVLGKIYKEDELTEVIDLTLRALR
jgi:TetR/AcrR family transcriptional regulator, transcriptional repressor for nem operon